MRERVILSGTIVGEGQKVDCDVEATKVTPDEDPYAPPTYVDFKVLHYRTTQPLPDGDYDFRCEGCTAKMRRKGGAFLKA